MILERGTESTNSATEHRLFVTPASRRRFPEQTVQRNNAGETPAPPNRGGSSPPGARPSNGESLRGLWTDSVARGVLLTHRNKPQVWPFATAQEKSPRQQLFKI